MEFQVLGPLQVSDSDQPVVIGTARKRQVVLAALLARAGQAVPIDMLIAAVWGDRPPASARRNLQLYVHQLRQALPSELISAHGDGYLVDPGDELDAARFRGLAADGGASLAASDPVSAATTLRGALDLWRGPAFGEFLDCELVNEEAQRLELLRLETVERWAEALLAVGSTPELAVELAELCRQHPYRESLRGHLMRALYQNGRQAEALKVFQETRALLVDQLGVEPGESLRRLHRQILCADPALAPADASVLPGSPVPRQPPAPPRPLPGRAASIAGAAAGRTVPAQLPADVSWFTGREPHLANLDRLLAGGGERGSTAVVISAVSGTAGVGKTALAVHWSHRAASRFPDGQLYVNLRGYCQEQPMTAGDALARFLAALGVPAAEIPPEVEERAARYRTEVAGRRMLILLDNASTVEQVRPLLPGTSSCVVLVTSRDSLAGLVAVHGAHRLDLDVLPLAEAIALLRRLIGLRTDAEPGATNALADQCARLPLALRVVAELAISRPESALAELVAELADQQRRLDILDAGGDPRGAVGAVFSWSIRHLPPEAARTFRLLGLHPGPDLDAYAAAALTGTGLAGTRRVLDLLVRAHLVHLTGAGRYGMHDLLRAYATRLTTTDNDARSAVGRLLGYYLATTAAAVDILHPAETHHRLHRPPAATLAPDLVDSDTAKAWLDSELPCLTAVAAHAAEHGWPAHAVRLSTALFRYLAGGHHTVAVTIHSHARDAARQCADRSGEARALNALGVALMQMDSNSEALAALQLALTLFQDLDNEGLAARVMANLGVVESHLGDYGAAANHYRQALAVFRRIGDRDGEARALTQLGTVERQLGRYPQTIRRQLAALGIFRELGERTGEASTLNELGKVEVRLGRPEAAAHYHDQALMLFRQLGNRMGEADALAGLGVACTRLGRSRLATTHHQRALTLSRELRMPGAEAGSLNGLGEAARAVGDLAAALAHHTSALTIATKNRARYQQALAHAGLGDAHHALGDHTRARQHYALAVGLYTGLGTPDAEEVRAKLREC